MVALTDSRDLRDPRQFPPMSELYRNSVHPEMGTPFHMYVDHLLASTRIPNYPQDELLSTVTQREYREELQQAAKEGDKYAAERLREL
jgi:hypothetical protein